MPTIDIEFSLNERATVATVEPRTVLLDYLREDRRLTGAKPSCGVQVCGACTVLVDWQPISACTLLVAQVHGREVLTIEGAAHLQAFSPIFRAFFEQSATQCGFCTPGMVMTVLAIAHRTVMDDDGRQMDPAELAGCLHGCVCRCTGYKSILASASQAIDEIAGMSSPFTVVDDLEHRA